MKRLRRLKKKLIDKETIPYLITSIPNIRYLTGFEGTYASMVLTEHSYYFVSDGRYQEYARSILPRNVTFILQNNGLIPAVKEILANENTKELYLEEHSMPLGQYFQFKDSLKKIKLKGGGDVVNELRMIKNESEIALLKKAASITDGCFTHILGIIKPGILEWDISVEIEHYYRTHGATSSSFESIVASGSGSSRPHYKTGNLKKLEPGDMILIDMGCTYKGYNSDLTRTVFLNSITSEFRHIYNIVLRAQETAINSIRPGITTGSLDTKARNVINDEGYGEFFSHSLGHGVGLEVHELPAVKPGGETRLKKNTVITIEPGIYMPGKGGVRIEDMVCIGPGGPEIMTGSSKDIIIL
ncbi:MAG: M24 family metallopeptidase [Spirochaetota bacterium]